jgi:phytoene dehydrogenase-like protein
MAIFLINASWFHNKNAGYPVGGAGEIVKRLVNRYSSLGGKLHGGSRVTKIIVENNNAVGVELENKKIYKADIILSAADGRDTIKRMLGGRFRDKRIDELYYDKKYEPKKSGFYVSLGVARTFTESYKPYLFFPVKKDLVIDNKTITHIGVTIHNFDPKAAPPGKTVLTAMIESNNPKHWINLRKKNVLEYTERKNKIADRVVDEIDAHFGNIKNNLEVVDIATPATYVRLTSNWNGAQMGWQDPKLFLFQPKKQIEGLKNFYMCGQWTGGAGLPGAAQSGREVAKMICKNNNKQFLTQNFSNKL